MKRKPFRAIAFCGGLTTLLCMLLRFHPGVIAAFAVLMVGQLGYWFNGEIDE